MSSRGLDSLITDLEQAAARLRAGDLDPVGAADLVEHCAELAGHIGAELDRAGREAERDAPAEGQEQLL